MKAIQTLTKNINLTEQSLSPSTTSITIDELNNEPKLTGKDFVWFTDSMKATFNENYIDEKTPQGLKAKLVFQAAKEKNLSSKAFKQMIKDFITYYEYPTWKPANILKYANVAELHNEDWYKHQLQTTDLNPEHFEAFLVDGKKMFCLKQDAHKVNLTETVQLYRPKQVQRQIEKQTELERSDNDKLISKLTNELLELKHENELLKQDLFIATGKKPSRYS